MKRISRTNEANFTHKWSEFHARMKRISRSNEAYFTRELSISCANEASKLKMFKRPTFIRVICIWCERTLRLKVRKQDGLNSVYEREQDKNDYPPGIVWDCSGRKRRTGNDVAAASAQTIDWYLIRTDLLLHHKPQQQQTPLKTPSLQRNNIQTAVTLIEVRSQRLNQYDTPVLQFLTRT